VQDIIFIAAVVGFFAVAVAFIRACEVLLGGSRAEEGRGTVSVDNAVGLALAVAVLAYLVYALLAPEKLG
jgi:K+-transporting ATPase KdpF subunit